MSGSFDFNGARGFNTPVKFGQRLTAVESPTGVVSRVSRNLASIFLKGNQRVQITLKPKSALADYGVSKPIIRIEEARDGDATTPPSNWVPIATERQPASIKGIHVAQDALGNGETGLNNNDTTGWAFTLETAANYVRITTHGWDNPATGEIEVTIR